MKTTLYRNRKRFGMLACVVLVSLAGAYARAGDKQPELRWQNTLLVQVHVADLDKAIDFYTETLGFTLQQRVDSLQWARIDTGIENVIIGLGVGEPEGSGAMTLNFAVADIDGARALLESKGVVFDGPTITIPGVVRLADFSDPDGNRFRLAGHSADD